jgi:hypothetical protein
MNKAEGWRNWLRSFPNQPSATLGPAFDAVDAYEACLHCPADDRSLQAIVRAASSPHKIVFEVGCHILVELARTSEPAQTALVAMSSGKDTTARFHAVAYLSQSLPADLRHTIVQRSLRDRSAKVRQKAIERAEQFQFKDLLPELETLASTEANASVRRTLALFLPLLRDGFLLERARDGTGWQVTVHGRHSITSSYIPATKYSDSHLQSVIAALREGRVPS